MRVGIVFAVVGSALLHQLQCRRLKRQIVFHTLPGVPKSRDWNSIGRQRWYWRRAATSRAVGGCRRRRLTLPVLTTLSALGCTALPASSAAQSPNAGEV